MGGRQVVVMGEYFAPDPAHIRWFQAMIVVALGVELQQRVQILFLHGGFGTTERRQNLLHGRM